MDVQKEVELFINEIENIDIKDMEIILEKEEEKITKNKNLKLFYKLLINKLESKLINDISCLEEKNHNIELNKMIKNELLIIEVLRNKYEKIKQIKIDKKKKKNDIEKKYIFNNDYNNIESNKSNYSLTQVQEEIYYLLKRCSNFYEYNIQDIIISFCYFIKNSDIVTNQNKIINGSNILYDKLYEYLYDNKELFNEFHYLIDVLTIETKKQAKDSHERKILKEINKKFIDIYNIYKIKYNNKKIDPYFLIIDCWLKDENNYLYIKELIKRKPDLCNIHNDDKHIVIYILEQYIHNFKLMIADKKGNYINKNYLKEIYYLFTKNNYLRMNYEEKKEINKMLYEFSSYIRNTLIKEKRKNAALLEINTLKPSEFYKMENEYIFKEYTFDNLQYEKGRILNNSSSYVLNKPYNDTFLISDYAYNIYEEQNKIILNMYSFDIHMFVTQNSIMENYFKKCEYTKEKTDEYISSAFEFKIDNIYPVICYSLIFSKSGKIESLKVSKDIIKITDKYNTFGGMQSVEDFYNLYKKSIIKNGGDRTSYNLIKVNQHFENMLNVEFVKFAKTNKIPLIYYGYKLPDIEEINNNMNLMSPLLYNVDKDIAYDIINIISSKIDKKHYTIQPIQNGVHDLKLVKSFNYIGLENQRSIGNLYFNEYCYEDKNRIIKEKNNKLNKFYKIVNDLNQYDDYVDLEEIKESKGKIKRRIKI